MSRERIILHLNETVTSQEAADVGRDVILKMLRPLEASRMTGEPSPQLIIELVTF